MNFVLQIKVAPVLTTGAIPAESWCSRRVETVAAMWGFHHCRKLPAPTKHLRLLPLLLTIEKLGCSSFVQEQFHCKKLVTSPGFVSSL
jgi:hypothetical protein